MKNIKVRIKNENRIKKKTKNVNVFVPTKNLSFYLFHVPYSFI